MGDPQAPFDTVLGVLDHHGLLNRGRLRDDVQLVSMGDHFDWGHPSERKRATDDAIALVKWLASHPPEQVVMLAGNHDLGRVCELEPFADDASFEAAWALAMEAYQGGKPDPEASRRFLERYPHVPDAECLARDFSCYSAAQRELVTELLQSGRLVLAHAHAGLLLVHAGVTEEDFALIGAMPREAQEAAVLLNAFLRERVQAWSSGPLSLTPLHQPGSLASGVARGVLFHRPAVPRNDPQFTGHRGAGSIRAGCRLRSRRPSGTFETRSAASCWATGPMRRRRSMACCARCESRVSGSRMREGLRQMPGSTSSTRG